MLTFANFKLYNKPMHSMYLIYCEKMDVSARDRRRKTSCIAYIYRLKHTHTHTYPSCFKRTEIHVIVLTGHIRKPVCPSAFEACLQFKWTSGYYLLKSIFPHNSTNWYRFTWMHSDSMAKYAFCGGSFSSTTIQHSNIQTFEHTGKLKEPQRMWRHSTERSA